MPIRCVVPQARMNARTARTRREKRGPAAAQEIDQGERNRIIRQGDQPVRDRMQPDQLGPPQKAHAVRHELVRRPGIRSGGPALYALRRADRCSHRRQDQARRARRRKPRMRLNVRSAPCRDPGAGVSEPQAADSVTPAATAAGIREESQPMDMTGEYRIPAPRQRVWEALNDPEILKAAIPGCEELNKLSRQ